MPAQVRDAFVARARVQPVVRKQVVIEEGSVSRDVYLVISGRLQFSLVSPQGREVILNDMGPGEMFGELSAIDGLPRSTNVIALEDGKLAHLTGAEFTQMLMNEQQLHVRTSPTLIHHFLSGAALADILRNRLVGDSRLIHSASAHSW